MPQERNFEQESRTETEETGEWDGLDVCCASRKQVYVGSKVQIIVQTEISLAAAQPR